MTTPIVAPYGTWKSPLTSDLVVGESISLEQMCLDGYDLYWTESRPAEEGRVTIIKRAADGTLHEITPAPFNARTTVHEYGGGAFFVENRNIYFSNLSDLRLYHARENETPTPITPVGPWRYADILVDRQRKRLVCVIEDHLDANPEATNSLISMPLDGKGEEFILASGYDFYSSPRLSPDGSALLWLCWNHPNMPWDGTELWLGKLNPDGTLAHSRRIAGGLDESIFQPEWSPDGEIYFVSDRNGWWNLYHWQADESRPVLEMEAEFGRPQWVFGLATYGFITAKQAFVSYCQNGIWALGLLDLEKGELETLDSPYTHIREVRVSPEGAAMIAGSPTQATGVVWFEFNSRQFTLLRASNKAEFPEGMLSIPETIEFPTSEGKTAHAFYYPPRNIDFIAPDGEKPPLLVTSHGGPTSAAVQLMRPEILYWTSRGFGFLDVNYGGSTGYGTEYRRRLNGMWGVVDMEDCANGARYLAERGVVDSQRLIIRGGSAGGYTTLCALAFRDEFKAGASYYGVADIEALVLETHKFESRYCDRMIGPYPQARQICMDRSPIYHVEGLNCPVIFFQGQDDPIVPPNQAEMMVDALVKKGVPVAYILFEGEGHGFRQAKNIKRSLEAELYFYQKVFEIPVDGSLEPVEIKNL